VRNHLKNSSHHLIYLFMLPAIRTSLKKITAAFGMSENAPPGLSGAPTAVNSSADVSRGVPYYEKIRRDLKDTIQKKRILDQNLVRFPVQPILAEKTRAENGILGNPRRKHLQTGDAIP